MNLNDADIRIDTFPEVDTIKQREDKKNYQKLKIVEICFLLFILFLLTCGWKLASWVGSSYSLLVPILLETIILIVSICCFFMMNYKRNSMHTPELYDNVDLCRRIWKDIEKSVKTGNAKVKLKRSNKSGDFTKLKISYLNENDIFCKEKFWLKDVYYKDSPDDRITISFYSTEEKDWTPFEDNEYVSITLPISYLYKKEEDDEIEKEADKTKGDE